MKIVELEEDEEEERSFISVMSFNSLLCLSTVFFFACTQECEVGDG